MRTVITKNGSEVATSCNLTAIGTHLDLPGVKSLDLVYFPRVTLTPPVTFEHLAGTGLNRFFDNCMMVSAVQDDVPLGSEVGPFRYVHGRSELMKGRHSVSAVLLAMPELEREISEPQWLSYLPEIWKHFLTVYDSSTKSP